MKHKCDRVGSEVAARVVPGRKNEAGAGGVYSPTSSGAVAATRKQIRSCGLAMAGARVEMKMNSTIPWRKKSCAFLTKRQDGMFGLLPTLSVS